MSGWLRVTLTIVILAGCSPREKLQQVRQMTRQAGPRTSATVIQVRTNLFPRNKGFLYRVIFANGKLRIGDELDRWRLFDLERNEVTFVDDITKTYRRVSFAQLVAEKRLAMSAELPSHIPAATIENRGTRRRLGAFDATQRVITLGAYRRELWFSEQLTVPPNTFPLILASEQISGPFAPSMRGVFSELLSVKGFPVLDTSHVPFEGQTLTVEKRVEKVEQISVPGAWLRVPSTYRDLTPPPTKSPAGRPPAWSPPSDRKTPAEESPPSATARTNP